MHKGFHYGNKNIGDCLREQKRPTTIVVVGLYKMSFSLLVDQSELELARGNYLAVDDAAATSKADVAARLDDLSFDEECVAW